MTLGNISSSEARMQMMRQGTRVNSRVPVALEWIESGKTMRAEGFTIDTSTKGCLTIVPTELAVGQQLKLINLVNHNVCEAVLAWRGHKGRGGWELGLELQGPTQDFWGLDF